mmetsp:Transcript_19772/g.48048  ORF Transcript_19772/g.48048 Transcript_19772/m.48048 type:complete len:213 (+) Transcript_19772:37-675(+)
MFKCASKKIAKAKRTITQVIGEGPVDSAVVADVLASQAEMMEEQAGQSQPTIALVAHEDMNGMMRHFVEIHREQLKVFQLVGTSSTCNMLRELGLDALGETKSGPLGGDQEVGAMICQGNLQAVFFFRDPLSSHANIADIEALCRLADCYQVYQCTNYRSASAVLSFMYKRHLKRVGGCSRGSVMMPAGVTNLADFVQSEYQKTRSAALAKA